MADAKRRQLSIDEAITHVGGDFSLATKIQTAVVSSVDSLWWTFMSWSSWTCLWANWILFSWSQCSLAWSITAFQTLLIIFTGLGIDPQRLRLIECTKTGGEACEAALTHPYPSMCSLPPNAWAFKSRGFSLVSEFNLVCEKAWLVHAAAGCFFLGTLLGCAIWHWLSDTVPPRRMLHTSAVISGVAGSLAATAPFLWAFMLFRALVGVGVGGIGLASFVLSSDVMGPSYRPYTGFFLHGGFSAGAAAATFLAWVIPSWRWITFLSSISSLALAIFTWSLLVESPQWLLLRSRKGEATAAIASIAFTNSRRPPEYPLADPSGILANPYRTLLDVLRNTRLRRSTALLCLIWFIATTAYYSGIMLVDALGSGNPDGDGTSLELALSGFLYELPGIAAAWLVAERLGRKHAAMGGLLQAGGCLLGAGLARGDAQRALLVAARFGLAAACSTLYLLSWEAFPSVVQHPGMAVTNYASRIGAVVAPSLALAATRLRSGMVSLLVTGATCLAAATLVTLLPETLNSPVYETIQDMNAAYSTKRHRSWTYSLKNVFKKPFSSTGGGGSGTPVGAVALPILPLDAPARSV